jgi:hypothetical protein
MLQFKISFILKVGIREAIKMEMNPLILESIWKMRKEEMQKEAAFKETYKLYPEYEAAKRILNNYNSR